MHSLELWTQKDDAEIRQALGELSDERLALDNALNHAVARARALGLSWREIGIELCISKQAAQHRWAWVDRDRRTAAR